MKNEAKAGAPLPRVVKGFVVGTVVASKNEDWVAGDLFGASLPFTDIQVLKKGAQTVMWKLTGVVAEDKLSLGLGVLGMPGSTAYGGLLDVLRPQPRGEGGSPAGETIWISGAAGAVGSLVGMIAKTVFGCTVIGSCGGAEKGAMIKDKFGFDHSIDYKTVATADELATKLKEAAPDGIDMYFDNVGGIHFEAAMACLRPHGRVAICGGITNYCKSERVPERCVYSARLRTTVPARTAAAHAYTRTQRAA